MVRKVLTVAGGILFSLLLIYALLFHFTSPDVFTSPIKQLLATRGISLSYEKAEKKFPATLSLHGLVLSIPRENLTLNLKKAEITLRISNLFGKYPLALTLRDDQGDGLTVRTSLHLDIFHVSARQFDFSSPDESRIPSFTLERLEATGRWDPGKREAPLIGKGEFRLSRISTSAFVIPLTLEKFSGEFFVKKGSLIFQRTTGRGLETDFSVKGTIHLDGERGYPLSLSVLIEDPSPLVENFLKVSDKRGRKIKIIVGGTVNRPLIKKVVKLP
ncbi:MAG: hypothetical protein D6713_02125 [Deltaproteobacteria bacterium]|nr:MAG: hypothetical protein D6713_02125 [Deltaproteobacteria bacterium]